MRLFLCAGVLSLWSAFTATAATNLLIGDPVGFTVSVDSNYPGYSPRPLTDGLVYAVGEERADHPLGPLGNAENAWHSADSSGEHWIELNFREPRPIAHLDITWGPERLWPRAFRLEAWDGERWRGLPGGEEWRAAGGQETRFLLRGLSASRLRIVQAPGGGSAARPTAMCAVEVAVRFADPDLAPALCRAGQADFPALAPELSDNRLLSYVALSTRSGALQALEFRLPASEPLRQIAFDFLVFGGEACAPVGETTLELLDGAHWRVHEATRQEDWSEATTHGLAQRLGRVRWFFDLSGEPISGARLSFRRGPEGAVVCSGLAAFREAPLSASPPPPPAYPPPDRHTNLLETVPHTLSLLGKGRPAPLQLPLALALQSRPETLSLTFPSPKMLSRLALWTTGETDFDCAPELYLEAERVGVPRLTLESDGPVREWSLSPLAVDRIDFPISRAERGRVTVEALWAGLHEDGLWSLRAIEESPRDLWGERVLAQGEPDYLSSAALMLPRRDYRSVHGAPDDGDETAMTWNGTHLLRRRDDPRASQVSRFLAFRLDGENFGEDYEAMRGGWSDGGPELRPGGLPERWFRYEKDGVAATLRSFTGMTDTGESAHLLHLEIELENLGRQARTGALEVATGVVRWGQVARLGILNQLPLDDVPRLLDGRLLVNQHDRPILLSDTPFMLAGTAAEPACRFEYSLAGGKRQRIALRALVDRSTAGATLAATPTLAEARRSFRSFWERKLSSGLELRLPEARLAARVPRFLADCLIIPDAGLPLYGSYFYEDTFGVEEGWPLLALARFGFIEEARTGAERLLQLAVDDRRSRHRQYRKGLAPAYAWGVYELCGDADWLARVYPAFRACAEETIAGRESTQRFHAGERVGYWGLLPRLAYGGDVAEPAYGMYANACAWRGLADTARAAAALGEEGDAERFRAEAAAFRADIFAALDRVLDTTSQPNFVPFSLGYGQAAEEPFPSGEPTPETLAYDRIPAYWGLFAGLILETRLFPPGSRYTASILDFMRLRGGLWNGQARFVYDQPDWDPHYGYGLWQMFFARDERDLLLLSFYGFLANNLSRDSWVHSEVSSVFPARVDNFFGREWAHEKLWRQRNYKDSEPIGSGAAILLCQLRDMLVYEGRDDDHGLDGTLHLLRNAPRAWLFSGQEIAVERAPTAYGRVSLRARGEAARGGLKLDLTLESPAPVRVRVHGGPPAGYRLTEVAWQRAEPGAQSEEWCEAEVSGRASLQLRYVPESAP